MNYFHFAIETNKGMYFGGLRASDGRAARTSIESYFRSMEHEIKHLEISGLGGCGIQVLRWKPYADTWLT